MRVANPGEPHVGTYLEGAAVDGSRHEAHFGLSTGRRAQTGGLRNGAENYVAETIAPPQHREPGKHPDVPLPGSSLSRCKQSDILSDLALSLSLKVLSLFFSFLFCLLVFLCCLRVILKVSRVSVNCVFSQVFKMSELLRQR